MNNLSICMPVYQVNVTRLVNELLAQCKAAELNFEICVIDDYSNEAIRKENRILAELANYQELNENIGRSRIRNLLAQQATGSHLLFLDCDVQIPPNFIENYIPYLQEEIILVHGGFEYRVSKENRKGKELRYKYGKLIEEQQKQSFFGCNFLVSSSVFEQISFDESITTYGFEDVLFANAFEHQFADITYINNPVILAEIDHNEAFIEKTDEAMQTLASLYAKGQVLSNNIRLLLTYEELKRKGILSSFVRLTKLWLPMILMNINSKNPSLKLFQLFKLIRFVEHLNR